MQSITKNLWTFILHFVKQYKWAFGIMIFCRVGYIMDALAIPYVFQKFINRLTAVEKANGTAIESLVGPVCVLILVVGCIEVLFRVFDYIEAKTIPALEVKVRSWITFHLQQYSYDFFLKHFAGDLAKRVNDLTKGVSTIIMIIISSLLPAFCTIVCSVFSFSCINPMFALLWFAWILLHSTIYIFFMPNCNRLTFLHARKESRLLGSIVDGFSNILSIKLFSKKNQSIQHLMRSQAEEKQLHETCLKYITKLYVFISSISVICTAIGLFLCLVYWSFKKMTISDLVFMFYSSRNICSLIWATILDFPDFFQEIGYCNQALKLLQGNYTILDLPDAKTLRCSGAAIEFKNISFSYDPNHALFDNQNISIAAGEKIGLVGFSGSGKSTLFNLLLRFCELQGGSITIDGQNITTVTQESLRMAASFVPQEPRLFHGSILDNIRYGDQSATDQQVIECAKKARCHDFIMDFPEGYHTLVGERGSKLSGGQRQRIAIARAMLKDTPIVMLDEATSALDAMTETAIQESLLHFMAGKTTLVISHRIPILTIMDRILVLEHGKIIAQGPHNVLLNTSPLYASMCKLHVEK